MRWARENAFDAILRATCARHGLPVPLVKGLIGQESAFDPNAERFEPRGAGAADDDASRGLMQILYATARDEVGYVGTPADLLDVATNLEYGCRYLKKQLGRTGGARDGAVSAYNGGYRPALGFGARATRPVTVCLARNVQGECIDLHAVPPGEFANQRYVDRVLDNRRYFEALEPAQPGGPPPARAGCLPGVLVSLLALLKGVACSP